jgi:hypothetical protein
MWDDGMAPRRFSGYSPGKDADNLYDDTVVAEVLIQMRRNGCMSVAGSIEDYQYAKFLLDTASDTLGTYHAKKRLGKGSPLIVPAHDTALIGTPEEKLLLKSVEDLHNANEVH